MEFSAVQIEELRRYFQPVTENEVTKLPDPKSVKDNVEIILNNGGTKELHKMINGSWYKVGSLTKD